MTKKNRILVLGVDGMDPSLSKKYLSEGLMPNLQQLIHAGSSSKDLKMLGGLPTITPPMWTSLATGATPATHGITCFWGQSKEDMAAFEYNMTSTRCKAEQLWNVTVKSGLKTLVWHWPGSSWPPSIESPLLHVVDGLQPTNIGGDCVLDDDKILWANSTIDSLYFDSKVSNNSGAGCTISDLPDPDTEKKLNINLILSTEEGDPSADKIPYDKIYSPLKEPKNWKFEIPTEAREFTGIFYNGIIHRPGLVLKGSDGKYSKVAIYESKKNNIPIIIMEKGKYYPDVRFSSTIEGKEFTVNRHMRILDIDENTGNIRLYFGAAMDTFKADCWKPKELKQKIINTVGPVPNVSMIDASDESFVETILSPGITHYVNWQARALRYLIKEENYDVVFSHIHNVDTCGHLFWYFSKYRDKHKNNASLYQKAMKQAYIDTDRYIGEFLSLLDEDWTIFLVSDHGLLTPPEDEIPLLGDGFGCNVRVMEELGYTVLKKNAQGQDLRKIDYSKTRAVANRGNHIYINLKGREPYGIVNPEDKYELERQIIDDLYNYRLNGKRIISLALRNKDALILGLSGDECGDIIYWLEEGANRLHGDSLSTFRGDNCTSVSPIFVAAGLGIKKNHTTSRVIRTIDVTPTIATLLNIDMPAQCEGAPIYQILEK